MILGIGTDIVRVDRLKRSIEQNEHFVDKIFTPLEIDYCDARASRFQSYAARFAAKEAVMKAIGTGWDGRINWIDIEVVRDSLGKPSIICHRASLAFMEQHGVTSIHLSLTHEQEYAIAYVILEQSC